MSPSTSPTPRLTRIVIQRVMSALPIRTTTTFPPLLCSNLSSNSKKQKLQLPRRQSRFVCCAVKTTAHDTRASRRACATVTTYLCGRRKSPCWTKKSSSIQGKKEAVGLLGVRCEFFARRNRGLKGLEARYLKEVRANLGKAIRGT